MPPHPLTSLKIQRYYQNESRFNGVYSRDNIPDEIKVETYITSLDEYADIGTHWIALYMNGNVVTYFDSFEVEHIPKEIKKLITGSTITTNIVRIQAYGSLMRRYIYIGFINLMLMGKSLEDFTNLFLPNNLKKIIK